MKIGEFQLIDWVRSQAAGQPPGELVELGIGDDCAVVKPAPDGQKWLVTTDMLLDGRHFELADGRHNATEVGRKAMGVNLSDIAAMAGTPVAAFVSVALPRQNHEAIARELTIGLKEMADAFDVSLAGGDTNVWDGPLVVNVAVFGVAALGGPVLRSGARPGDCICVSGPLGGSLPSGRHMRPVPQLQLARELKAALGEDLHAMIDLSDGLGGDLRHILNESGGLGAVLQAGAIPIHADVYQHHPDAADPLIALTHALGDGEDFELCCCVEKSAVGRLSGSWTVIGEIVAEPGFWLVDAAGRRRLWEKSGFDHLGHVSKDNENN